ncbi:MAG: pyridoxamine 5'-phosphate oxidase family protein [Desulfamplus sp.]|nr:pyridoxamine 5'-phosphate oxidase family protein [Desulfamplus sp.]
MNKLNTKALVDETLKSVKLAVLATEHDGQPHTSLVAITPIEDCRRLVFATYRNTLKYQNLKDNPKVAVFINGMGNKESEVVLTAVGKAEDVRFSEKNKYLNAHRKRHPELDDFLNSSDCALICITIKLYQVVRGINDIIWWSIDESE